MREGEGLVCLTQEELAEIHAAIRRIEEGQQAIMDSVQGVAQRQESVMRYMASSDHEAEVKMNAMRADLKRVSIVAGENREYNSASVSECW